MPSVTFDTSLAAFCSVVYEESMQEILEGAIFVRDHEGRLQLTVQQSKLDERFARLSAAVAQKLGRYSLSPVENVVRETDSTVVNERHLALPEWVEVGAARISVRLIDKRLCGQDWLKLPASQDADAVPRLVFWSLKGGVGRTTALVALAVSLARSNKNVLVIDLDLEAPGVGDLLLKYEDKPKFGVLDYLAENGVGNLEDEELLANLTSTSHLVQGQGLVDVCPASGRLSTDSPQSYLAKLFRAYGPVNRQGQIDYFVDRVSKMVGQLEQRKRYDAVLVDARAGLNESTAAALLGLGADVLLFGHNTPQTFAGYSYAFAHFSRLVVAGDGEWRLRLKMVHAKAPASGKSLEAFRDNSYELVSQWLYEEDGDFAFSLDDVEAPHYPWTILDDSNYGEFDPIAEPDLLDGSTFSATFGPFIGQAKLRLQIGD